MHIQQMSDAELASYASFIRAQVEELASRVRGNQQHPAWIDWTQACMIADEVQVELLRRWLDNEEETDHG